LQPRNVTLLIGEAGEHRIQETTIERTIGPKLGEENRNSGALDRPRKTAVEDRRNNLPRRRETKKAAREGGEEELT
jgi:hypothetical protein